MCLRHSHSWRSRRQFARSLVALARARLDQIRGRTSVTDESSYTTLCVRAAKDPVAFSTFRRHPAYIKTLEHVTKDQGAEYLEIALEQTPAFASLLDRFRSNDELGSPQTFDYGNHGRFAPTTLRYVKVLSDLVTIFGSLDGLRIIEIGAGYGGQCAVTAAVFRPASYLLVDLEPCLELQQAYLGRRGIAMASVSTAESLGANAAYDLVISNYAFTECVRNVQDHYLARVLERASRGYITANWISPPAFRCLTPDELLDAISGSRFLPERPLTAEGNRIWVWGSAAGTNAGVEPS